jgi:hypothetical protein
MPQQARASSYDNDYYDYHGSDDGGGDDDYCDNDYCNYDPHHDYYDGDDGGDDDDGDGGGAWCLFVCGRLPPECKVEATIQQHMVGLPLAMTACQSPGRVS